MHNGCNAKIIRKLTIVLYLVSMKNTEQFFEEIRKGNLQGIKLLTEVEPQLVNATDSRGSTPLILASYYNFLEITDFLIEKGVPIDEKDGTGNTALMGVCFKGFTTIAKKLIEHGANVNERNTMGATPLIYAVTFNKPEIAKMLLDKGADRSVKDARGNTALDHAKLQGSAALIDLLEAKG